MDKRIKFELPLPSMSLKKFIEKLLVDNEFLSLAMENPVGCMRECGVNIDMSSVLPADFAVFFGAVATLKDVLKETKVTDLTFDKIFGQPAVIRGAVLNREMSQGFFREWDNRDAVTDRLQCYSTSQKFEVLRDRTGAGREQVAFEIDTDTERGATWATQRDVISQTFESSNTDNHTKTDWSNPNDMQRSTGSDRGVNKNFEASGFSLGQDRLRGPLINPVDLAAIAARIQSFAQVLKSG